MSGKLITAFHYGYAQYFNQNALNAMNYMWPNFGYGYGAPSGFSNSKWASMSIQYTDGYPSARQIQSAAQNYGDYGAIMMFNVRNYDASGTMNNFASRVWGGKQLAIPVLHILKTTSRVMAFIAKFFATAAEK